jgi:hypothetical protein
MKRVLIAVIASCVTLCSVDGFAATSCKNEAAVQKVTSLALSKLERMLTSLERRFESMERSIENRRINLVNRQAGVDSAVAAQESRMATCDVAAGILTQIFNDRNVTRATCTSTPIVSRIVGTAVDVFVCKAQCALLGDPSCTARCEQRIAADARRCSSLAKSACVRAVGLRVQSDVITKQLNSPTFISTCTNGTPQGCPNGQLRNLLVKILKTTAERDAAKLKADAADAALAACSTRGY